MAISGDGTITIRSRGGRKLAAAAMGTTSQSQYATRAPSQRSTSGRSSSTSRIATLADEIDADQCRQDRVSGHDQAS